MTLAAECVFVVDDDPSVCKALGRLFRSSGRQAETFPSAAEFLRCKRVDAPSCLVLDVEMPDIDGLQLQLQLQERFVAIPIVFLTGHGDIPMSVQAMKAGAANFLTKPVEDDDLLDAVTQAIAQDKRDRETRADEAVIRDRAATLSPREREVLTYVVTGRLNKQIARRLGITEKTVKVHRGQVMRKMHAGSLAELVRMADRAGIEGPQE